MAAQVTIGTRPGSDDRAPTRGSTPRLSVLPTKLQPPYRRPGIIDRPRLIARLRSTDSPIVALIAPAGYGKSIALARFVEADERVTAWFSADQRDSDVATLVRGLVASIDQTLSLPDETVDAAERPGHSVWTLAVPRLAAALRGAPPSFTLVIDDVDRIESAEAIAVILALADQLVGVSRLLLGGRTVGAVPYARLISDGRLATIGREELALDEIETGELLHAVGLDLSAEDTRRLTDRTEGWAAGVYLSSLATGGRGNGGLGVSPSAPERHVEEYLREEILAPMTPEDADLILRSSILERLSGPLCDSVLERTGSGAALDRLERSNLLLIPLDVERRWLRYHHLFGELLARELERRDPGAIPNLRRRAARWHEDNGIAEPALEYALAAGDEDRAARLTVMLGQKVINEGRAETVRRWFAWFEGRPTSPNQARLAGIATMVFSLEGDVHRAVEWADRAEGAETRRQGDPGDPIDRAVIAMGRVMLSKGGLDATVRDAGLAVELVPDDDPWRVAALTSAGIAHQLAGDTDAAESHMTHAVATWDLGSVANTAVCMALIQLAASALERGNRASAERHVRKARGILMANGMSEEAIALGVDALSARIAMAHGAAEQAQVDLAHAQRLRPHLGVSFPWLAIRARLDLVRAHLALGDAGGARTISGEIREILEVRPDMGTLATEFADLQTRLGAISGGVAGASTLTLAELRLLPLLTTHLTFRDIGERLFVSQNTVKTQAISIYRKLDATSRGEAIQRAVVLGLLESATGRDGFIRPG